MKICKFEKMETEANCALPYPLKEGEEVKLVQAGVNLIINYNTSEEYSIKGGTLALSTKRVVYFVNTPEKKLIYFQYPHAVSFGINKLNLVVSLSSLIEDQDVFYGDEEIKQEDDEIEEEELDENIEKIKKSSSFKEEDNVNLLGRYQVTFDFSCTGLTSLGAVLETFNFCSNLNPDEEPQEIGWDDNEFFTSDDFDVDENGNVIFKRNIDEEGHTDDQVEVEAKESTIEECNNQADLGITTKNQTEEVKMEIENDNQNTN